MSSQHGGSPPSVHSHRMFRWFGAGVAATLILGAIGYRQYEHARGNEAAFGDSLFYATQLLSLHTPHLEGRIPLTLAAARWIAVSVVFFAVLQVALHISKLDLAVLLNAFRCNLVVVCGLTRTSLEFVRFFRKRPPNGRPREVIVIDLDPVDHLRRTAETLGAHIAVGDATEPEVLEAAGVRYAKQVLVMLPDDATNLHVTRHVTLLCDDELETKGFLLLRPWRSLRKCLVNWIRARRGPLDCRVLISDIELLSVCRKSNPFAMKRERISVRPVQAHHAFVRRLLTQDMPLDRKHGIPPGDPRQPCLVIVGLGKVGRLLAIRAAQLAHYANGKKLRLVVVDRVADVNEQRLLFRHPAIREVCDLEFHKIEAESLALLDLLKDRCDPDRYLASVAVCFQDASLAVEVSHRIKHILQATGTPLAVRFTRDEDLADLLLSACDSTAAAGVGQTIIPFGTLSDDTVERLLRADEEDALARQLHGEYVQHKLADSAGHAQDPAMAPWEELAADLRESNRQQADHLPVKLRAIGYVHPAAGGRASAILTDESDVELLARMEHARWVAERLLAGWQWGPTKDPVRKINPALVPWEDLDEKTREIDRQYIRFIPTLLARCGRQLI